MELVVYALDELGFHDCCVRVFSDNMGVIGAFDKGRSRNFEVNLSIRRAAAIMASCNITLDLEYILTSMNPADPISHGELDQDTTRLDLKIPLSMELAPFLSRI